ncbi:hypothetical protein G6F59_017862 [Rhizopus arrhizus]|nr:hypothetical protein G6F59_017862 [Rhizopus arrhizus]
MEVADQAGGEIGGVHLLLEHARTAFHRAAADQAHVVAGHQVDAERVVRVQARDHDVVGQRIAGGTVGSEEQRLRAGLVGRLAAVAQPLRSDGVSTMSYSAKSKLSALVKQW